MSRQHDYSIHISWSERTSLLPLRASVRTHLIRGAVNGANGYCTLGWWALTPLTLQAREVPPLHRTKRKGLKAHRNYTVEEVARLLGVARGTVRRSTKKGLRFVTERRPRLIRGDDLLDFLAKMKAPKARCQLHECYCFKCRAP
jgi:excisionase family DNA binding protein